MDPACLHLLTVTTRVLELGPLLQAGDAAAAAEVQALAELVKGSEHG